MHFFCTLFDSSFLSRGVAMYESLKKHCNNFHLFIFPFDDKCYDVLLALHLEYVTLISLSEFEDEALLSIKSTRSKGEYCWTATSSTILYCIEKFNLEHCAYLDADLYFFSSPELLLKETVGKSILITEHRYSHQYDRSKELGKYCVQLVYFRNDKNGMKALRWWRNACLDWCYDRQENGKFGDQKYLDDWSYRFEGVVELKHLGGGVAPWNVQQYDLYKNESKIYGKVKKNKKTFELVFYHFHGVKILADKIDLSNYYLSKKTIELIYKPYIVTLIGINNKLRKIDSSLSLNDAQNNAKKKWWFPLFYLKHKFFNTYNVFSLSYLSK